ncbi:MAG: hypothetical protein JXA71_11875 [Chitinispirillaceae bacterium]|nr:hypothetical protein [Chitinispirillaceae bacterium]
MKTVCRLLFVITLLLAPVSLFASGSVTPADRGQTILDALKAGQPDAAFARLERAAAQGLPDDSLYYLWAEVHIAQGFLDTALALSIAAARNDRGTLSGAILAQQHGIYSALGMKDEAARLLDTIMQQTPVVFNPIPTISITGWGGLNQRNSIPGNPYPFINTSVDLDEVTNKGADIAASSTWYIPLRNGMVLAPALTYNFTNGVERTEFTRDSLNHAFGVSLDLKNIWRRFSLGLAPQYRISLYGDRSWVNTASLTRSRLDRGSLTYSSLVYSIETGSDNAILYQSVWGMHYLTRKLTPRLDLNILPLVTCFFTDDLTSSHTTSIIYIEDPNADTVRHYTDASCTRLIPLPVPINGITQIPLLTAYRVASDRETYSMTAPESYIGITPAVGLELALPFGFSIEGTVKGMVNYYLGKHEWTTFSVPASPSAFEGGTWLAYATSDGRYYLVEDMRNVLNAEKYSGPFDIRHFKKQRIDFMAGGELVLERRFGKLGTLGLNAYIRKYRSTLQNESPVIMKELFYGAGVMLRTSFGAAQPLSAL